MFLAAATLRMMTRRKFKSLAVIGVSLVLVLFMNIYAESIVKHQAALNDLHAGIEVTGNITSHDGSILDDLDISGDVIGLLEQSGFIAQGLYTRNLRFLQGPWPQLEPVELYAMLVSAPKLVGATDIAAISSFASEGASLPEYMEGYDQGLFSSQERVCIASGNFLQENGLELGDEIKLTVAENPKKIKDNYCHGTVTLQIVGTYQSNKLNNDPLYCLGEVMQEICQEIELPPAWDSARFTIANTQQLNHFKALLRRLGFVSLNQVQGEEISEDRLGFIINDSILTDATASVTGYIALSRILYPIIYLLCAGIGFVVSYLLVRLRKPEFAIMRSLGTSRAAGFVTLFLEQALLAMIGAGLGILLTLAIVQGNAPIQFAIIAGYLVCYLVGAAIAISTLNRVNVIQILTAKE
ncbi:MAG TPA: hypothetical protein DDY38_10460 [Firmicutes bacterium]|nr:hypothetical protein [Bacillota bacterium]